jgi:hypothetical protein
MTCPHLKAARCALAELLVDRELSLSLECPTTPETCAKCVAKGQATEDNPWAPCLGNATRALPADRLPEWSAFCSWVLAGKSRGLGDTIAKVTRATGVDKVVKATAKVLGTGCGCSGRQKKLNDAVPYVGD